MRISELTDRWVLDRMWARGYEPNGKSLSELAKWCEMSKAGLIRVLKRLEESEQIRIKRSKIHNQRNRYWRAQT